MAFVSDSIKDNGLSYLISNSNRIDICNAEPATYIEATSTYSIGSKESISIESIVNGDVSGRKIVIPAISDGIASSDGTASFWALTDGYGELLVVNNLDTSVVITNGNTWSLTSIDITIRDPE